MNGSIAEHLAEAARQFGTPLYVYDLDMVLSRLDTLQDLLGGRFGISFAVKSNPNKALLRGIRDKLATFDVSSFAEAERALAAGGVAAKITFSGPAKRREELERAIAMGLGELVVESIGEARLASQIAQQLGAVQDVLLRINPLRVPRHFGASMAGKPSQFGIDEEVMEEAIGETVGLAGLRLIGFHIYSGTNSLSPEAIAENFEIFIDIFKRASAVTGAAPKKLVFGSGFGIPYLPGDEPLDMQSVAAKINPLIDGLRTANGFEDTEFTLEMGRWLVGPAGWLLSSVISAKSSRGIEFRACDAGFNNHLAACGMMGSVIRRNWIIDNITSPAGELRKFNLVGPLCTTIDIIASNVELPDLRAGDVIAISQSGAYGLTASPTRFISHPEPLEVMLEGGKMTDVTESRLNHWAKEVGL